MKRLAPGLAALALVLSGPHRERFEVIHGPRVVLFLVLAAALLASGVVRRSQARVGEGLGLSALLVMALSAVLAQSPAYALVPLSLTGAAFAVWLGTSWREDEREIWLRWMAGAALAVAVLGLLEVIGLSARSLPGRAPSGTMGQRNALAHFLVLASPLLWTLATRATSPGAHVGWTAGAALLAAMVVETRCRAAWLVGPVVFLVYAALTRRREVAGLAVALGLGVAIAVLSPNTLHWAQPHPYADTLHRLVDASTGSGAGRFAEWKDSLGAWRQFPLLGAGPGNWFVDYGVAHGDGHFAHSDWVGILFERGAVGLILYLALGAYLLWQWRGRPDWALVVCTLAAAAGLGAFDSVLQLPAPLLWVTLVTCVGERGASALAGTAPVERAPWSALAFAVLAVAACLAFASRWLSTSESTTFERLELASKLDPLDGELRLTLAEAWGSAGRCERARPHLDAAERLLPTHPRLEALAEACGARLGDSADPRVDRESSNLR